MYSAARFQIKRALRRKKRGLVDLCESEVQVLFLLRPVMSICRSKFYTTEFAGKYLSMSRMNPGGKY